MIPLKLKIQAFGSYGQTVEIDFTKIKQNILLICGDTGSGKSTIFDAIAYALYGEGSLNSKQDKKEDAMFQSQFAEKGTTPEVAFTFARSLQEKDKEYTILRIPKHVRPPKRGKNEGKMVAENGSLELRFPDGSSYKDKDTQKKINAIVGLTRQQFMQVAMIAQGEFMEMLHQKSTEKRETFRKLFNTEVFQKITIELDRRYGEAKKKNAEFKTRCTEIIASIPVPEDYAEKAEYEVQKKNCDKSLYNYLNLFFDELEKMQLWEKEQLEQRGEEAERIAAQERKQNEIYGSARTLLEIFEKLEKSLAREKELLEKKVYMQEKKDQKALLEKVFEIKPYRDAFEEVAKRQRLLEEKLHNEEAQCPEQKKAVEELEKSFEQIDKTYADSTSVFEVAKKVHEETEALFDQKEKLTTEIDDAEKNSITKKQELEKQTQNIETCKVEMEKMRRTLEEKKDLPVLIQKKKQEKQEKVLKKQSLTELYTQCQKWRKDQEIARDRQNKYKETAMKTQKISEELLYVEQLYFDDQAGILAERLEPGKPCPVCGALEHPQIHERQEETVTQEQVEEVRQKEREIKELREKDSVAASAALEREKTARDYLVESAQKLGVFWEEEAETESVIQEIQKECDSVLQEVQTQLDDMEKELEEKSQTEDKYHRCEDWLKKAQEKLEKLREEKIQAEKDLATKQSSLKMLLSQMKYESREQELALYRKAERKYQDSKKQYDLTVQKLEQFKNTLTRLEESISKDTKRNLEEKELLRAKTQTLEKKLQKHELPREKVEEVLLVYSEEDLHHCREEVEAYEKALVECSSDIKSKKALTEGKERPDLQRILEQLHLYQENYKKADEQKQKINSAYQSLCSADNKLRKIEEEFGKEYQKERRLRHLYEIASGNVTGRNKMDLETYVQRYYLKNILIATNKRYVEMNAGQFEIVLKNIEDAGKVSNEGLDFMVHSLVTDSYRDIRTLSGGESFMAALSLALGIADCIQGSQSGIHLDMMFIDEGFGTLDDHSRENAVRILKDLAGGQRLIGIISHVTELKNTIDDRLIITKDRRGSHIHWDV